MQEQIPRIGAGASTVSTVEYHAADTEHTDFSQVDRRHDRGLTNTKTSDETAGINSSQTAVVAHENSYPNNPEQAQLARGPDTANAVTNEECAVKISSESRK